MFRIIVALLGLALVAFAALALWDGVALYKGADPDGGRQLVGGGEIGVGLVAAVLGVLALRSSRAKRRAERPRGRARVEDGVGGP